MIALQSLFLSCLSHFATSGAYSSRRTNFDLLSKKKGMKKNLTARITSSAFLMFSILLFSFSESFSQTFSPNQMLIKFKPSVSAASIQTYKNSLGAIALAETQVSDVHLWHIPNFWLAYMNHGWININEVVNGSVGKAEVNSAGFNYESTLPHFNLGTSSFSTLNPTEVCPEFTLFPPVKSNVVKVAVLDTGIGYTGTHNDPTFCNDALFSPYYGSYIGYDYVNNDSDPHDDHGHGSHIAGIIAQMATFNPNLELELMSFKTHNNQGLGIAFNVILAIDQAVLMGADIINMSFSYPATPQINKPDPLQVAIEAAGEQGVLVIAAAGNVTSSITLVDTPLFYPAAYPCDNIISVTSVNCDRQLSNFGAWSIPEVDIAMLGESIQGPHFITGNMVLKSGTSQAAAIVSGIAAQLASNMDVFHYAPLKCSIMEGAEYTANLENLILTEGVANAQEAYDVLMNGCETVDNLVGGGGSHLVALPGAITSQVSGEILSVFPNPFQHGLALIYQAQQIGEVTFTVSDARGSTLYSEKKMLDEPGNMEFSWSPGQSLAPGLYFTRIHSAGQTITKKVVKE